MKGPVLIVDSRAEERLRTAQGLSQAGFQAVPVPTPQDALDKSAALEMRLAVIELDAFSPEVAADAGGFKARWPNIGIVALASAKRGKTDTEMLAGARAIGAHAFFVHPVAPADLARRLDELARQGYGAPERRRTALVVDDSETIGEILRAFLKKNGFNTVVKPTWEAALSGWDTLGVDLVFTDIFMPGMGGVEGIRHVRANWAPVPIVAFSEGLGGRMDPDQALLAAQKIGADAILSKPLSEPRVMAAVRSVFAPRNTRASA
jgi:DNA-binding response OmpR family regulator